jgi:HAD superfamily hydrolase (TIGR01490 family)
MIREALAGKRVLITGVTGFLGQAVLERVLSELPETRVIALVRPRGRRSGRDRLVQLADKPVLARWRERVGSHEARRVLTEDVEVVQGDLDAPPTLPGDLDVVLHCAAAVAFDPPIDEGCANNIEGPVNLYRALRQSGARPHVVHVSTAYVAGDRKGVIDEAPLAHHIDWRAELTAARQARPDAERASREPRRLEAWQHQASRVHRKAGPQTTAGDVERRRVDWVEQRLVDAGRARAQSLGWPDVYTLTKALGERAAEQMAGGATGEPTRPADDNASGEQALALPLSIVRPSIVESALRHPYPGWIDGFKMAEPLIIAYGRGVLPEFPGIPEGVVDFIPVDLVACGLLAVAAQPPEARAPAYYHISSGSRNPLTFNRMYELVRDYFRAHPMPQRDFGEASVPEWSFPGRGWVERRLGLAERAVATADRVVTRLPRSTRTRGWMSRIHQRRRQVEFLRRYADLYAAYAEAEVIYTDDRAHRLHQQLPAEERDAFGFDAADIDWRQYLQDIHCPSVTAPMRHTSPRVEPRTPRPEPAEQPVMAVFDLEGTLLASNVIEGYLWLRLADLPARDWPGELANVARSLPKYLATERRDRSAFLREVYRRYAGASLAGLQQLVAEEASDLLLSRVSPAGLRQVRAHRACGHHTVLLTGALDVLVEPLRPLFDEVVAARLGVRDGRCTGYLAEPPVVGEARAEWLTHRAARLAADLRGSYAYGDSHSDLPLLERVGNPVVVNPDPALYQTARARRWPIERWEHAGGGRVALPAPAAAGRAVPGATMRAGP